MRYDNKKQAIRQPRISLWRTKHYTQRRSCFHAIVPVGHSAARRVLSQLYNTTTTATFFKRINRRRRTYSEEITLRLTGAGIRGSIENRPAEAYAQRRSAVSFDAADQRPKVGGFSVWRAAKDFSTYTTRATTSIAGAKGLARKLCREICGYNMCEYFIAQIS